MDDEMPPDPSPGLMLLDQVILRGHTENGLPFEHVMNPCIVHISRPEPDETDKTANRSETVNPPEDPQ